MKKIAILLSLVLMTPVISHAEDILYVMSKRAKILSSPEFGSKTIVNVLKGEKLVTIEKNANWYKVKYEDKIGWLSRLSVSYHPPMKRKRRIASVDRKLLDNSRRRASSVSTTAAVRGLSQIERSRGESQGMTDFASLEKMESLQIEDATLFTFIDGIKD